MHRIDDDAIRESSGLVRSRVHEGVFWTHNDSGDLPRIFAIDREGHRLAEYAIEGAQHRDWEDIAVDDRGHLYIADVGNNANTRRDLAVYVVAEPSDPRRSGVIPVEATLRFRYAEQRAFPDDDDFNYDSEAVLYWDGALFLFTKHRSDTRTRLYRLPVEGAAGEEEVALERLAEIDLGGSTSRLLGNTTGADISPDGRWVALLTYRCVYLYERHGPMPWPSGPVARILLDPRRTRQVEGVAWDDGALLIGNEQRRLFRIADPFAPWLWRYPPGEDPTAAAPAPEGVPLRAGSDSP